MLAAHKTLKQTQSKRQSFEAVTMAASMGASVIHEMYAEKGFTMMQRSPKGAAFALYANLQQVDWTVMSEEEKQRQVDYLKPMFAQTTFARKKPEAPTLLQRASGKK